MCEVNRRLPVACDLYKPKRPVTGRDSAVATREGGARNSLVLVYFGGQWTGSDRGPRRMSRSQQLLRQRIPRSAGR